MKKLILLIFLIPIILWIPAAAAIVDLFWWFFTNHTYSSLAWNHLRFVFTAVCTMAGMWSLLPILTIVSEAFE